MDLGLNSRGNSLSGSMTGEGVQGGHEHDHGVLWATADWERMGRQEWRTHQAWGSPVPGMWAEPRVPWLRHSDRAGR